MDVGFNPVSAAIAGTARAQSSQSTSERSSFAGGVAEHQKIHENTAISTENRTEDRDADGRQLLDYPPQHHQQPDTDSADSASSAPHGHRPLSLDPHLGKILDFDA